MVQRIYTIWLFSSYQSWPYSLDHPTNRQVCRLWVSARQKGVYDSAMNYRRLRQAARAFLRLCLGLAFLSAIADRFGFYGPRGAGNVSWGDWSHFLQFVAYLNWFVPKALIPAIGVVETIIEFALAVALLAGVYQRIVAWASTALLASFALTMSVALGVKAPLGYGVFTAVGAAFLLGAVSDSGCSAESDIRPSELVAPVAQETAR